MNRKIWLVIFCAMNLLILLLSQQVGSARALAKSSASLPPLRTAVIKAEEMLYEHGIPVRLGSGIDVTDEMQTNCGLDCVKWFWGGTSSVTVMMSRTASEEDARKAAENLIDQYRSYEAAFWNYQEYQLEPECAVCEEKIFAWQFHRGFLSDDIVYVSTHGTIWIMIVLHMEADPAIYAPQRDYCLGEACWKSTVELTYLHLLPWLMQLQHQKLALNGFAPVPETLEPLAVNTPAPTPITPPPTALHQLDFLAESPVCTVPCLGSLEPGKSTVEDIPAFFEQLGMTELEPLPTDGEQCMDLSGIPGGVTYPRHAEICITWENSIVQTIVLDDWNHPELFYMKRVASRLGTPNHLLAITGHGMQGYEIGLSYPEKRLMMVVTGQDYQWSKVCLGDRREQAAKVILFSEAAREEVMAEFVGTEAYWYDWAENKEMSTADLFSLMQESDRCIPYFGD